jgi:hypothetical protein
LVPLHYPQELALQKIMKFASDYTFNVLRYKRLGCLHHSINLRNESLFFFRKMLPWNPRLLFLNFAALNVDQHLNAILIGLLQKPVGCPNQKAAFARFLKFRQFMKVLNMERHGHEVVCTEGP